LIKCSSNTISIYFIYKSEVGRTCSAKHITTPKHKKHPHYIVSKLFPFAFDANLTKEKLLVLISDMASSILCGNRSSFSTQFYLLALIALVLVCFCSYCSSSFISPNIDADPLSDEFDNDDGIQYYVPLPSSSSHQYVDVPQKAILPSKNRFMHLLLKSITIQPDHNHKQPNSKRYSSQAFHAMRG
jgi:hypothetical protein